ncbi:MAG TPA: DUF3280 domain-containing protein [Beijerinckiaceae bacterium]|jgi:hypothetical protein
MTGRDVRIAFLAACLWVAARPAGAETSAAVFDFDLVDTSLEASSSNARPDEARRLILAGDRLRELLRESGIAAVDLGPARERIERLRPLRSCNGCEVDLARELGATLAVTGMVHKVSNLILTIDVMIRDARTGAVLRTGRADIRGNTDESWLRGVGYVVRNRLLDPPLAAAGP